MKSLCHWHRDIYLKDGNMLKEKKGQIIDRLTSDLSRSEIIISTNYKGLSAKQMEELRQTLTKAGGEFHVVKNTLTCIAANKVGKERLVDIIDGTVAIAFSYGDIVGLAKALNQYMKGTELPLKIRGALLGERILTSEEVIILASLPSKEVLISQLIAWLQAPMIGLRDAINFPLQGLVTVLQNRKEKFNE